MRAKEFIVEDHTFADTGNAWENGKKDAMNFRPKNVEKYHLRHKYRSHYSDGYNVGLKRRDRSINPETGKPYIKFGPNGPITPGQGVAEGSESYPEVLYHGSTQEIKGPLTPRQSYDIGGAPGSNKNAIYATDDPNFAIAYSLAQRGSDTGTLGWKQDPHLIFFGGKIRHGQNAYIHVLPTRDQQGQPLFVRGDADAEWYSRPEVKAIKPIKVEVKPVDQYLHLLRKPTPEEQKLFQANKAKDKAKQGVAEGVPQPGKSSGKPISWISPERVITKYLTLNEILNSVQGIPYYNEVVKDRDTKDFTWGVTKKVLEYARELIIRPDAYKNWPPIIVVDGKLQDGAHRISTINLMQKRVQPNNPIWKNAKLKVEFGESDNVRQGVAEGLTPNTIHKLADRKGIKWDDEPSFLKLTKRLTGKDHLDDLDQTQLQTVKQYLEKQEVAEGSNKKEATRRIQKMLNDKYKANLDVDGILGPLTLKSINKFIPNAKIGLADEPNKTTAVQGKKVKDQAVAENFADGKNPQDRGDSARHGIPKHATIAQLEKIRSSKTASPRKKQLAHWQINMRRGKAKK
jgi:hypothetical protein